MINLIYIAALVNVLIGTLVFNWAWKKLGPIIDSDETVDAKYSPFRRVDAKKWNKLKFFLGAITVMPIRIVIGACIFLSAFILVK